jgi:Nitrile hydratase beta subunit, C-terminal
MNDSAGTQRFAAGTPVRIRADAHAGHHRTPLYLKGKRGVVVRHLRDDPNPEALAYGKDGLPLRAVYTVRFTQRELWPDYRGPWSDTLLADFFEHWLERAE